MFPGALGCRWGALGVVGPAWGWLRSPGCCKVQGKDPPVSQPQWVLHRALLHCLGKGQGVATARGQRSGHEPVMGEGACTRGSTERRFQGLRSSTGMCLPKHALMSGR